MERKKLGFWGVGWGLGWSLSFFKKLFIRKEFYKNKL